jgi:hypothetical protein
VAGASSGPDMPDARIFRQGALIAFMGSGLASSPTKAQLVSALATARRSIAALQARHQNVQGWLSSEIRLRGIRGSAATVAALEIPEMRDHVAIGYRHEHPERIELLDALLNFL